jgi:pyruvate,water dikinase
MLTETYTGHLRDSGKPVDFPVAWTDAEYRNRTWRWDAEHSPFPLTPLSQQFRPGTGGFVLAISALGGVVPPSIPAPAAQGYRYAEAGGSSPSAQPPAFYETLAEMAPRVTELWDRGWRLHIESRARETASFDYDSLALPELAARFKAMTDDINENMVLMFEASYLVNYSRNKLAEFCSAHAKDDAEALVRDLLQGFPSASVESGAALWDVAQLLNGKPQLLNQLRNRPDQTGLADLASLDGGPAFIERFNEWLDRYGRRNGTFGEIAEPGWLEDPRVAIGLAVQYASSEDPRQSQQKAITTRLALQHEFEQQLGSPELVETFRKLLSDASPYLGVRESRDHAVNMALTSLRAPTLAIGRQLVAAGTIDDPSDVFFLQLADIEDAASAPGLDLRAMVTERRERYRYWCNVIPPAVIGAGAAASEPVPGVIRGIAASAGIVTARARVVLTLDQAHTLLPGEVLVTRGTTPAWTLLFGTAAGVVTEGGGMLSHCAIVAREYGIPAVVGASGATRQVHDGDLITVDGSSGRVLLDQDGRSATT